jgi:hypothetical protein
MPSFEYDVRYLQAGLEVLQEYLLSPDLYWPAGVKPPTGDPPYPQLTLGNLLLARQRAAALADTLEKRTRLAALVERLEGLFSQWRAAWGRKAAQEVRARQTQWANYLDDYREQPEANYDRYPYEVFRRAVIHLLTPQADGLENADHDMIAGLDRRLGELLSPGDFVWSDELKGQFPLQEYWYLYGRLLGKLLGNAG